MQQVELTYNYETETQTISLKCDFSPCGQRTPLQTLFEQCHSEFTCIITVKCKGNYRGWLFATYRNYYKW